jgi:Domain of unknown function (DUF4440)
VRRRLLFALSHGLLVVQTASGQTSRVALPDSALLARLDAAIEAAVVRGDTGALDTLYAGDFRFTHSTGEIDDRRAWLQRATATPRPFRNRSVDSVAVEVHGPIALTSGRLTVVPAAESGYVVRYLRLYAKHGKRWELKSHRSIELRE